MTKIDLNGQVWEVDFDSPLGKSGGFGAVFEGRSPDGESVAIKQLKQFEDNRENREMKLAKYLGDKVCPLAAYRSFPKSYTVT